MKFYQRFLPYGVAVGSTAIALLLKLWLEPFLTQSVSAFFFVAITLSTWYGGLRPGFVAIILSTLLINTFFVTPVRQLATITLSDVIRFATFCLVAVVIDLLSHNLRNSKRRIEQLSQQLLEESADQLRMALSAAQMGMWNWNIVTGEINWSPEHEQLFGLTPGTFDGKYETFKACLHPDDRENLNQAIERSLRERVPYQQEYRVVWADGSVHWIEGRGQAFYDEAGQPTKMTGTVMLLDERKQAEAALQERETILRLFIQYAPASIAMFDRDMRYIMASQIWVDEYNLGSIESVINRSHYELFPEIPERWRQIHQRCLAGAIEKCEEDLFVRSDGTEQWLWWDVHPWYTATHEIGGIIIFAVNITQRKQAEIVLRESQIQLQRQLAEIETIYQSAPIGLNVLDTELRFVRINQRLAEINGLPVEAHIGRTIPEVLPDLADAAEQTLRPILETGEALLNVEITGETPAQPGVQRTWLESFLPLKDGEKIIGISTVCEEITQRKQAEIALQQLNAELERRVRERTAELTEVNERLLEALTALEQSEERRRLALDLTHIGFWDLHLPSGKLIWNDNLFTLQGLAPHSIEPSYELCRSLVHPDDVGWVEQRFLESMKNHTDYVIEYRVVHPDNSVHWVMGRGKAIYDELGQPVRSLGVVLDISDPKRTEEELRQSEAKFRSLSESSPLGIFMTNIGGQCIYTNPRYQAICGCTFDEALGDGWVQFIHPEDREQVAAKWSSAVSQGKEFRCEIRYVHKDGTIRFCRVQSAPIFSVADEVIGYVGTVEDITESRVVETMKNEFISIVSHELRTPLTSIRGSLGLVAAGVFKNKPEAAQKMLDIATRDTERLVRLVNDILDLERLEAQKVNLVKQWCDAETLLEQSAKTVQSLAAEGNITLCVEAASIQIWVDCDRIIQTLVNLVSNAIKFSPPETTVTLSVQDQADRVLFQVKDQGRGIPADKLDTIFGRFQQVDASDSRQKGGTGLGLAICKSIVQQHGGKIWVESVVGEGSSFYFTLPKSLD